jgi:hypothetical protein
MERYHWEELGVDWMVSKCILEKEDTRVQTRYSWIQLTSSCEHIRNEIWGFRKRYRFLTRIFQLLLCYKEFTTTTKTMLRRWEEWSDNVSTDRI